MASAFIKSKMRSTGTNTGYRSFYINPLNDCRSYEEEPQCWSLEKGKKPKQEDDEESSSSGSSSGKCGRRRMLGYPNRHYFYYYYCDETGGGGGCKMVDPRTVDGSFSCRLWEDTGTGTDTGTDVAPASSWSTLPKRSLLCRTLPLDIGPCSCYIIRERPDGYNGALLYSLYTHEGKGRVDRKLAVARHGRTRGCSEFVIGQNSAGIKCKSDESFMGTVTANFMGSRYQIWDQGSSVGYQEMDSKQLLAVVNFVPTITTLMGSFRRIRAYIPKDGSMPMKNPDKTQHSKGLRREWKEDMNNVHQLLSKVPYYNKGSKQYELDFRERSRLDIHIKPSVKNFQLTLKGGNTRQSILLFGKIGKSKYVMEYKSPLTGYQAFAISLASMDSKFCCSI